MKRPVIGITASHDTEHDKLFINSVYLRAIRNAGGIPMIFPMEVTEDDLRDLVTLTDGVLFTGGDDIHPFLYGHHCPRYRKSHRPHDIENRPGHTVHPSPSCIVDLYNFNQYTVLVPHTIS